MRHIFLLLLITALLLGQVQITSAATTAATSVETPTLNIESAVLEIQVKIAAHWPHMDKVWPTYDYSNHNLIPVSYTHLLLNAAISFSPERITTRLLSNRRLTRK